MLCKIYFGQKGGFYSIGSLNFFLMLKQRKSMFDVVTNILVADIRCVFWNLTKTLCTVIKTVLFCPVHLFYLSSSTFFYILRASILKDFSSAYR